MQVDRTARAGGIETQVALRRKPSLPVALLGFCRSKPLAAASGAILIGMVLGARMAPRLAPYSPEQVAVASKFGSPGTGPSWAPTNWDGTC